MSHKNASNSSGKRLYWPVYYMHELFSRSARSLADAVPAGMQAMHQASRLRMAHVRESLERLPTFTVPPRLESPQLPHALLDRLVPRSLRDEFLEATSELPLHTWHECLEIVGEKEHGTAHPHLFLAYRDEDGLTLSFIDPEPQMGTRHRFRPSASNLLQVRIHNKPFQPVELAILRYRRDAEEASHHPSFKLKPQVQAGTHLIEDSALPINLPIHLEDIVFRFSVTKDPTEGAAFYNAIIQARHSSKEELQSFLDGRLNANSALQTKAQGCQVILERLLGLLQAQDFAPVTEATQRKLGLV